MEQNELSLFTAYEEHESSASEPERILMLAILRSAMDDIARKGEPYREARRYFMSNDESYLFSFLSVCSQLNLCPKTIRRVVGLSGRRTSEIKDLAA